MIIGTVASSRALIGGVVESPLYTGALVVMDFENNVYRVNGSAVALSDLFDNTDFLQAGGYRFDWNTAPAGPPINFLSTGYNALDLSVGFTLYLEFIQYDATSSQYYLDFWNSQSGDTRCEFQIFQYNSNELNSYDWRKQLGFPYAQRAVDLTGHTATTGTLRKIACTSKPTQLAMSEHGAIGTDSSGANRAASYNQWVFGGSIDDGYFDCDILMKRIIFYPPKDNSDLQALTIL